MSGYTYPKGGPPADLLVEGWGPTLGDAFAQVAYAMTNAVTPLDGIQEREEFMVEAEGSDLNSLLLHFLEEMLFHLDLDGLVARRLEVAVDEEKLLVHAKGFGEHFTQATHRVGIAVKAVTYHMMEIRKEPAGYRVRLVFDT
jgi:SHS2 domain-containing protein